MSTDIEMRIGFAQSAQLWSEHQAQLRAEESAQRCPVVSYNIAHVAVAALAGVREDVAEMFRAEGREDMAHFARRYFTGATETASEALGPLAIFATSDGMLPPSLTPAKRAQLAAVVARSPWGARDTA